MSKPDQPNVTAVMTLEEARRILESQDVSDLGKTLEAVALVLRFNGIADARLLPIANQIEDVRATLAAPGEKP